MLKVQNEYDLVSYPGTTNPQTHPDSLAAMAILHGLTPAPVESCRVLELGCNEGNNLIPMAYAIPRGSFTGVDLASQPIQRGQKKILQLGLSNIRLLQADIADLNTTLGEFDYIVAHGVYAWVPEHVRDALLAVCRQLLAPQGIAFVSYNALPGGHIRNLIGEILSNALPDGDHEFQLQEAFGLLDLVAASRPPADPLRMLLETSSKKLRERSEQVTFHDELAPAQRPVSFRQFVDHAERHGLQYLCEARLPPPTDCSFKPEIAARVKNFSRGDPIAEEQMFDLIRMRMYRESLLCRAECAVDRDLCVEGLLGMRLACRANRRTGSSADSVEYVLPSGVAMSSAHHPTVLLMDFLIEATPHRVSFCSVAEFMKAQAIELNAEMVRLIMQLVISRFVELHVWEPPVSTAIASRPHASDLARLQGAELNTVTTLLHESLELSDLMARRLLLLLDGTRDREELHRQMTMEFPDLTPATIPADLAKALKLLHQNGVLQRVDFA